MHWIGLSLLMIFLGFVLFFVVLTIAGNLKIYRIRKKREGKGFTRERFVATFCSLGVPEDIPSAVFDYYTSSEGVPLSPDDAYGEVLSDDQGDIEDDVYALADKLNLIVPREKELNECGKLPLKTVRDTVLFLDWVRRRETVR